jgi:hypothetical protein
MTNEKLTNKSFFGALFKFGLKEIGLVQENNKEESPDTLRNCEDVIETEGENVE